MPLRYVVLRHEGFGEPHFDLMLELSPSGKLRTWRTPVWPLADQTVLTPLGDHRAEYLDYEGPVPGNRGVVKRVAQGTYEIPSDGSEMFLLRFLTPQVEDWLVSEASNRTAVAFRPRK